MRQFRLAFVAQVCGSIVAKLRLHGFVLLCAGYALAMRGQCVGRSRVFGEDVCVVWKKMPGNAFTFRYGHSSHAPDTIQLLVLMFGPGLVPGLE